MLVTSLCQASARPAPATRTLQVAQQRRARLAQVALPVALPLQHVRHHLLHPVMPDTPWPTMSVLPVLVTRFLQVAHHRHALLAQLAFTVALLLLRALHVALV